MKRVKLTAISLISFIILIIALCQVSDKSENKRNDSIVCNENGKIEATVKTKNLSVPIEEHYSILKKKMEPTQLSYSIRIKR